jgi:hypothetical protein
MRRKNWTKIIKKSNLFDRRRRYTQFFLNNLKLRRDRNLLSRNFIKNYFFYKFFLKTFKKNKTTFLIRSLFLIKNKKFLISPDFSFKKNFFNTSSTYNDFLKKANFNSLFLTKNYSSNLDSNQNFGLNYYLIENKSVNNTNLNIFNNDEFKDVIKIKFALQNSMNFVSNDYLNIFFNYNLHTVNIIELYKIIILLNFYNL